MQGLDEALASGGSTALFDLLIAQLRDQKNYGTLFNARLMRKRFELGLPPIQLTPDSDVAPAQRDEYERSLTEAARDTGRLFLAEGQIERAWPYFQAIGEIAPVADAIDALTDPASVPDRVVEIAFYERANQRRGFELIIERSGVCSALTAFSQYQDHGTRDHALRLLVDALYRQLSESLARTIAAVENVEPDSAAGVRALIANREWLFAEMTQYIDSTHLAGILPYCRETGDRAVIAQAIELADYAAKLSPMFHFRGEPPFDEIYEDHAIYLRALLGEGVDTAVDHFRVKAESSRLCAEAFVRMLLRLERYGEALAVSLEHLDGEPGANYPCPSAAQLCQLAGDAVQLSKIACDQDDPLLYAAALLLRPAS